MARSPEFYKHREESAKVPSIPKEKPETTKTPKKGGK